LLDHDCIADFPKADVDSTDVLVPVFIKGSVGDAVKLGHKCVGRFLREVQLDRLNVIACLGVHVKTVVVLGAEGRPLMHRSVLFLYFC
jgi:hypothetical protein